jgi:hypothetical protein
MREEEMGKRSWIACFALVTILAGFPRAVLAQEEATSRSPAAKGGLAAASLLLSVPYCPTKLAFALGGSVVSGTLIVATLGLADETAAAIAIKATNGDYVISPQILAGERPLIFVGSVDEGDEEAT